MKDEEKMVMAVKEEIKAKQARLLQIPNSSSNQSINQLITHYRKRFYPTCIHLVPFSRFPK